MKRYLVCLLALALARPLTAQSTGAIAGYVRDAVSEAGIAGAVVTIEEGRRGAVTDSSGAYRIREVRAGSYAVDVRLIGYRPVRRDTVTVRSGETTLIDFSLQRLAIELDPLVVEATPDPVLDPLATSTEQRITASDLRELPVSSLEEAVALSAGAVGESYRGGRLGQTAFVIDGLGVKNQLDASTGSLGLRIPPDILTEASLVTNGFSARYGQALSGLINVVTRDGGEEWTGRMAYESDRPFSGGWDMGLDRLVAQADGPLFGGITALVAVDASARLDAEPVNAPAPDDPRDPRAERPWLLPHNSGEQASAVGKLTIPIGRRQTLRVFGLRSVDQRLLYDPAFKYDAASGPARSVSGTLLSGHVQHASGPEASLPLVVDLRVGHFDRDFIRGALAEDADYRFGAFTGQGFSFIGEDIARARDTAAAAAPIPGLVTPDLSDRSPWGVPAFFLAGGTRGELAWNRFRELRGQLDATIGIGQHGDLLVGGEYSRQRVETFQRAVGYLPVGGNVPGATTSRFTPSSGAAYVEGQYRLADIGITGGLRYDHFDARQDLPGEQATPHGKLNPRIGISTMVRGATIVASIGRFSQAPDYQYLVDAAFEDTTRTGRFRQGNPNLGFESSWQYELSVRARVTPVSSIRFGAYVKRLEGLVASVALNEDPDASFFGNDDAGTVRGAEVLFEREISDGWGFRASYTLQQAMATSTNAFLLRRLKRVDPFTGDTIQPGKAEFPLDFDRRHSLTMILQGQLSDSAGPRLFGTRPVAGLEAAIIGRYNSGLPFTRFARTDTVPGVPNDSRLPANSTIDLLIRRPLTLGGLEAGLYFDVRNVLNRRNIVAVRRDTGLPQNDEAGIEALAEAAYTLHPEPIPYESVRYREFADLDGDGYVQGREELFPLYVAAARDFSQPLFAYGAPRLVRLGVELLF